MTCMYNEVVKKQSYRPILKFNSVPLQELPEVLKHHLFGSYHESVIS